MLRLLVLIALAVLVAWALDTAYRALRDGARGALGGGEDRRRGDGRRRGGRLVRCARCGTHVAEERAVTGPDGARYCSPRCRDQAGG